MNKKERESLAYLVAEMIYDFSSGPQLVSTGRRILEKFPGIRDEVLHFRYANAFYNVLGCFHSAIHGASDPNLLDSRVAALASGTSDFLEKALDEYLDELGDDNTWLYGIEEALAESNKYTLWPVVRGVLEGSEWTAAVSRVVAVGSEEFDYLTCKLTT